MYKLKTMAKRVGAMAGAVGLLAGIGTSALPAFASADALNPLTERSLTLSSSSPGWSYLDGSGNVNYAPPHSGANGKKTGETFKFRMSSTSRTIKAMTFQFCTTPAGNCVAPGNNTTDTGSVLTTLGAGTGTITLSSGSTAVSGSSTLFKTELNVGSRIVTAGGNVYTVASIADDTNLTLSGNASASESGVAFQLREADTSSTSDLNVATSSPSEISTANWADVANSTTTPSLTPPANNATGDGDDRSYMGNFVVLHRNANLSEPTTWGDYTHSADDWGMSAANQETGTFAAGTATGKSNMITITSPTGQALTSNVGDYFQVVFFGTDNNYITNPGIGAFFVRMNTYDDDTTLNQAHLVDGGVTVANVMNESISIQTKVLETMAFSVGIKDPDTYSDTLLSSLTLPLHGQCNTLLMADPQATGVTDHTTYDAQPHNVIKLGDQTTDFSLATGTAKDNYSYWRLSSNSSGGATVYYTGHTLTNTEGDQITPLTDGSGSTASNPGTEQFGLAIDQDKTAGVYNVDGDSYGSSSTTADFAHYLTTDAKAHSPKLAPLVPMSDYANGKGTITASGTAGFAFNAHSDTYAVPIATETTDVVDCVTAKMRYVANIAATTPAGLYTTKVNYVASPQY
jgi:hypothetical protein